MSFASIEQEIKRLADLVRDKSITVDDLTGEHLQFPMEEYLDRCYLLQLLTLLNLESWECII